uniref:2-oxoglutarate dehydrogenase, mitochondrial n=1 Tax=Timema monikensis TaxID=170555 RepID=A0A7R9EFP7_9NEOP|nr:unnamed protein product [Timema monikensis]
MIGLPMVPWSADDRDRPIPNIYEYPTSNMHRACISLTQVGSVGGRHFTRWLLKSSGRAMVSSTNQRHSTKVGAEPFLNGTSAVYMEEMYKSWCIDPKSVHVSWQIFFSNCENDVPPGSAHQAPPLGTHVGRNLTPMFNLSPATSPALGGYLDDKLIDDHLAVQAIIRSYQVLCLVQLASVL